MLAGKTRTNVRYENTTYVRACQQENRTFFRIFLFCMVLGRKTGENPLFLPLTAGDWYSTIAQKLDRKQYPDGGCRERAVGASPPKPCGEGVRFAAGRKWPAGFRRYRERSAHQPDGNSGGTADKFCSPQAAMFGSIIILSSKKGIGLINEENTIKSFVNLRVCLWSCLTYIFTD